LLGVLCFFFFFFGFVFYFFFLFLIFFSNHFLRISHVPVPLTP
jgi:hypothetical protein